MEDQETETQDIVVTYDTLFEILRNEKTKEDLQKLHGTFFHDVVGYLNEKQEDISENKDQKGLFDNEEREKRLHQIGNIKKILKDIYERREKKIISMAVNKSRFSSNIIDTSSLLEEEKLFYDLMISLLDSQRDKILQKLLNGEKPELSQASEVKESSEQKTSEEQPKVEQETEAKFEPASEVKKEETQTSEEAKPEGAEKTKLIRFLISVPQFMGEDMLEYGPYEEEDVAKVPEGIASLLIEKERAEEIKEN